MKLTRKILNQIIKEEIQTVLKEGKTNVDRTNTRSVLIAAKQIISAEEVGSDRAVLTGVIEALTRGSKKVAVVGGPKSGDTIDLLKHVVYID